MFSKPGSFTLKNTTWKFREKRRAPTYTTTKCYITKTRGKFKDLPIKNVKT